MSERGKKGYIRETVLKIANERGYILRATRLPRRRQSASSVPTNSISKVTVDGPAGLDAVQGVIEWDGPADRRDFEELRSIEDTRDAFKPDFELGTDEHSEWVRKAKAAFE